jgi:hypothetical protein
LRPKTGGFKKIQEEREKHIALESKNKSMSQLNKEKKVKPEMV